MTTTTTEYAPVDPKIAHPLGRLRGIIRRYVTIEGLLSIALFVVAWFWIALILDFGVFKVFAFDWALEAPKALRGIALALAAAGLAAILVRKIVIRLTRDFSNSSLALILEKRFPNELGDRLITAVQLSDLEKARQYGYSTDMIQKTVSDVRERIDQIPVKTVFNWKRLWRMAGAFLALTVGLYVLTGIGYCAIKRQSPVAFYHDFGVVTGILAERDLGLQNTPWPRRAYLEVVDFPGDEMRIGRDAPSPKIRVAAYQWVIADSKAPVGWRPLTWADVPTVLPKGTEVATLPLQPIRDARFAVDLGPLLYGSAHPFTAPTLPADLAGVPDDPAKWPVDRVQQVFVENPEVQAILGSRFESDMAKITAVLKQLDDRAADPGMARTLRKLEIPREVSLSYKGAKTKVEMTLRGEANNEFTGTLADLKESVRFTARGENYRTQEKLITLVPPPMLQELKRDEYHPAYLYHKAPFADAKDLEGDPEQKPYLANPKLLKGVRHVLRDQVVSLTGDRSRFDIPMGTEFTLTGRSDKPLVEAKLLPKPGKFPGVEAEIQDPDPIPLPITDGHVIKFEFTAANKMLITRQTDFDIFLKDTDGVTSKRPVQIVVEEDRPPDVDVVVDVIRKVGGTYICTPQALIPFTRESKVRDDKGLNRVEFVFGYTEVEPPAVIAKRAEFGLWFLNSVPVMPTIGDPLYRVAALTVTLPQARPALSSVADRVPIPAFLDEYKRPNPFGEIQKRLDGPRPSGADVTVVNSVDFRGIEDELKHLPEADDIKFGFDLRKVLPGLKRATETEAQRVYLMNLNVVAVDTNVEGGKPGVGQSKEVLVFKLVGDGDLLTEIAREEASLADKLDDAIRRLADVDQKLRSLAARLPGNKDPEQFVADQTRSNELLEQMAKAKDITGEVHADYLRILLEFKVNRLPEHLIKPMESRVVNRLGSVLGKIDEPNAATFPKTEEAYGRFHSELGQGKAPVPDVVFAAQQQVTNLLTTLREIRSGIGQGLDLKKVITQVEAIIKEETGIAEALKVIDKSRKNELQQVTVRPPNAPISIVAGQRSTVRVSVEIGDLYNGTFTLKAEASPGSELKVPSEIKLKETDREFALEIGAGQKTGNFWVRVTPDIGPAKDVRVIVR
jgi:hypothetical protein